MNLFSRITYLILLLLALLITPAVHAQNASDQILYAVGDGTGDNNIYKMDVDYGLKAQIASIHGIGSDAQWSPAGKFITLLNFDANTPTLTVIDADTGHKIVSNQLDVMPCALPYNWSHDDEWLSYMVQSDPEPVRKLLNMTDGTTQILPDVGYDDIQWSVDNRYLAYHSFSSDMINPVTVWNTQSQKTLMVLDVESSYFLKWSPVGNHLAFIPTGSTNISIYNADDNTTHQYDANEMGDWSPDGKFLILYRKDANNQMALLVLDVFAGKTVPFDQSLEDADVATTAAWSADGHYLAMTIRTAQGNKVWVLDIKTKHLYDTTLMTRDNESLVWSPASNQLAFTSDQDIIGESENFTSLWVFDVDHQQAHQYDVQIPLRIYMDKFEWSPTGQYLTVQSASGEVLLDWKTGSINLTIQTFSQLSWSPDGTQLALSSYGHNPPDIYVFNPDRNTLKNITNTPNQAEDFIGWRGGPTTNYPVFCGGEG